MMSNAGVIAITASPYKSFLGVLGILYLERSKMNQVAKVLILVSTTLFAMPTARADNVVTDWSLITAATATQGGKGGYALLYQAYTSIAVYDAVNSIHRRFRPFYYSGSCEREASDEAAAAAASHGVLVNYFPDQKAALDTKLLQTLASIAASADAKRNGVRAGEAAASVLVASRVGDGLETNIPYTPGTAPGDWQPTPPGFQPAAVPWLGQMRPFTMKSASQFLPRGPYPLTSEQWAADYNLTRLFGELNSSVRTPGQTEIGLFWTDNPFAQDGRTYIRLIENNHLDIMDSARLMAILWTGYSDSLIGCFNAKYAFSFWRPVSAIPAGGGNPELAADAAWMPLAVTPNHPEYPAAHTCGTGAVSDLVADFFGTQKVHVVVDSLVFSDGPHTHIFENTEDWLDEVFWARIYSGFHFHHSLEDGAELGHRVSHQVFDNHFQRLHQRHHDDDGGGAY